MVGRLVEQQQLGFANQRARQRETFALSAGQLADVCMRGQTQTTHRGIYPRFHHPAIRKIDLRAEPFQIGAWPPFGRLPVRALRRRNR